MLWSLGVVGGVEITSLKKYPFLRDAFNEIGGGLKLTLSLVGGDDEGRSDDALSKAEGYASSSRSSAVDRSPPVVFMKAFADGSIGARTASFTTPYLDGSSIGPLMSRQDVARFASDCISAGLLPMIHAIGDRALDSVIEGMDDQGGIARVEHMEYVRPDQAVRLARSRVIACMQPNFQERWGGRNGLYESRLGGLRTALNDFRTVSNTGIPLCFGTDLMPPGPLKSIPGATEHPLESARLPLPEVIRNFSSRAVHCSFITGASGKLTPGSPGDVLVTGPDGTPLLLAVGGVVVHRSEGMPDRGPDV
jgi:predicted amidohydrolase YtcJ